MSKVFDNKTMCSWRKFPENAIKFFIIEGYKFKKKAEMNIVTIAINLDMSYDFYNRHNMHAIEWKLNALINKDKI